VVSAASRSAAGGDVVVGGGTWTALVASLDPVTSTLARWWAPG
jgi:hypothetical protein